MNTKPSIDFEYLLRREYLSSLACLLQFMFPLINILTYLVFHPFSRSIW
jgi:hypothetical protein